MHMVKKRAIRMIGAVVCLLAAGTAAAVWFKYYR